jgi:hypothetical protein
LEINIQGGEHAMTCSQSNVVAAIRKQYMLHQIQIHEFIYLNLKFKQDSNLRKQNLNFAQDLSIKKLKTQFKLDRNILNSKSPIQARLKNDKRPNFSYKREQHVEITSRLIAKSLFG